MLDIEFTPRGVTKFVVSSAVAMKAKQIAADAIVDHTRFEERDMFTRISSDVIGGYVGHRLKPITNKMVDKTVDYAIAKKDRFVANRNNTEK
jgi:hypothetical protein